MGVHRMNTAPFLSRGDFLTDDEEAVCVEAVKAITFGGGVSMWSPVLVFERNPQGYWLQFSMRVPCRNTGEMIPIAAERRLSTIDLRHFGDSIGDAIAIFAMRFLREMIQHETDESIRVDGVLEHNPHVNDRF